MRKGQKMSPESRAKVSASLTGKSPTLATREKMSRTRIGKKHSPECKARISAAQKGKPRKKAALETRAKLSIARMGNKNALGHKHTLEELALMKIRSTGRKHSAETLIKMSASHRGKKHSAESRAKISAAKKGIPCSDERRIKLSRFFMGRLVSNETRAKMVGENNPRWKGGITTLIAKIRQSHEYREWRTQVYQRDDYTCGLCGNRGRRNLNAHHILPFSHHPERRFDISNGITLCEKCHNETKGKETKYVDHFAVIVAEKGG